MSKFYEYVGTTLISIICYLCDYGWFFKNSGSNFEFNLVGAIVTSLAVIAWTGYCNYTRK